MRYIVTIFSFLTLIFAYSDDNINLNIEEQINKIKQANSSQRYILMNELKLKLREINIKKREKMLEKLKKENIGYRNYRGDRNYNYQHHRRRGRR